MNVWETVAASAAIAWTLTMISLFLSRRLRDTSDTPETWEQMERVLTSQQMRIDAMNRRQDEQAREIDALREEREADHAQMNAMQREISDLLAGVERLIGQLEALHQEPIWRPGVRRTHAAIDRPALAGRIKDGFSLSEMDDLAYDIGLKPEAIVGETDSARARALVDLAARTRKLATLAARVAELRPEG